MTYCKSVDSSEAMGFQKRILLPFFLISLFLIFPKLVYTQENQISVSIDTLISHSIDEVVISASRFGSNIMNTSEAIRVLKNNSIRDHQARTIPEALNLTPGVFVQKTNHGGGSPFLRGLTGNQTLLLIDGIRLSNSIMRYGPNQYFNTIDVFSIGKIEVLRGSGSVQYGSDAIGGTLQVFSHEVEASDVNRLRTGFLTRFATHGMEKSLNLNTGYHTRSLAFRANLTYRNFGDLVGGDTTCRQKPSGYKELDYDIKGKVRIADKTSLTFTFQDVHQKNIPVYHKIVLENYQLYQTDPQKRQLAYIRLKNDLKKGILKSSTLTLSYQNTNEGREMRKNGSHIQRKESDKVRTYGLSEEIHFSASKAWNGNLGFELYSDNVNSTRQDIDLLTGEKVSKRGLYPDGSLMTSVAIFSVHNLELGKWRLSAGTRYNTFVIKVTDEQTGLTRLTPSAIVGNLGALRKLTSSSSLFISFNTGFRAPNIDDLGTLGIVDFRFETPNFSLQPEKSFQYQIGYRLDEQKLKGEFYMYRNELFDLITRKRVENQSVEGYPLYMKENSDRAFIQGFETSWDYFVTEKININGTMTYTYGQNVTNKEPLRRIPPLYGSLSVDYNSDPFSAGFEWIAAGKQDRLAQGDIDDNRIPEGGTPGWDIFNIDIGYDYQILHADLCFKNIFNKDYRYHGSGINGYGRSVFITLEVNF